MLSAFALLALLWQPYTIQSFDGRELRAETAMLAVPEHRGVADSRWIRVAVVRIRGNGSTPTVFLSGGPGIPATALARVPVYFDLFDKLRAAGDVLLIDQRGSGLSLPNLTCPPAELPRDAFSSDDAARRALRTRVQQCVSYFRDVDLDGYTTREIASDVDTVRGALGIARVRLLAFSYGSEVAFELLRTRPRTIERVVFASTRAPDTMLKLASVWDRALGANRERVARLVQQLDASGTGSTGFLMLLRSDLSDGRALPKIPALLTEMEEGNYATLHKRVEQLRDSLGRSFNLMTLAVDCSSGWSDERRRRADAEAETAVMRNVNLHWDACFTRGTPPKIGRIDVPSLFITGELDPNSPPEQTDQIRRAFTRSRHVIVPGAAHETLPITAVQHQVLEFLAP